MTDKNQILDLTSQIDNSLQVGRRLFAFYENFITTEMPDRTEKRKQSQAIVIADIITKYYTCMETAFLRISRFFENSLAAEKWHQDLLEKMTYEVRDIRPRVISPPVYTILLEFLKFRHFSRYYFQLEYDWDKIDFLSKKFQEVQGSLANDLKEFQAFLEQIVNE